MHDMQRFSDFGLSDAHVPASAFYGRPGGTHMRFDVYTKTIVTIIALLLAVMVLKPIIQPQTAIADGGFAGIQFSYSGGNHAFFNANTGDVWEYGDHGDFRNHYKVHELGKDHGR
jgi:hypothetical protein